MSNEENLGYKLVICPICHQKEFEQNDFKSSMIVQSKLFQFLKEKEKLNLEQIGTYICLQRFDPVVYPDYDFQKHRFNFVISKPQLPEV